MKLQRRTVVIGTVIFVIVSLMSWLAAAVVGDKKVAPSAASAPDQLADLERRISKLEKIGPFIVLDTQGKVPIFSVFSGLLDIDSHTESTEAVVYNWKGRLVAKMGADQFGGYFKADSADKSKTGLISFDSGYARLSFQEQFSTEGQTSESPKPDVVTTTTAPRLQLGRGLTGNYALNFFANTGTSVAGIGESQAGNGAIVVGDPSVTKRVSMQVGEDGKGIIGLFNGSRYAVAVLGEAIGNTGGSLVLGDAHSEPRVKMGTNENRYGVVLTLPQGLPYVPKSGLPGSYLLGCAGGPSCVP